MCVSESRSVCLFVIAVIVFIVAELCNFLFVYYKQCRVVYKSCDVDFLFLNTECQATFAPSCNYTIYSTLFTSKLVYLSTIRNFKITTKVFPKTFSGPRPTTFLLLATYWPLLYSICDNQVSKTFCHPWPLTYARGRTCSRQAGNKKCTYFVLKSQSEVPFSYLLVYTEQKLPFAAWWL